MEQFSYSFAVTLAHSIWQMAVLLLFYGLLTTVVRQWPPLAKRNLLFFILGTQVLCSCLSFYIVYSDPFSDFRYQAQDLLNSLSSSQSWLHSYAETLSLVYAAVVMYKLTRAYLHWISFRRHYKTMLVKPSIDLRLFTQTKAYHFGISKRVAIWYSENIHSPMTFGFLRPVILLPVALVNQLSLQQTESLIIHELSHIKNNDFLLNWFLVTAEAIYFFNPFVKIVANKIRLEREQNCDLQVLQFNYPAIGYAETLLHTARHQKSSYSLQLSAVKCRAELLHRIRFFTTEKSFNHNPQTGFSFALAGISLLLFINLALAGYFLSGQKDVIDSTMRAAPLAAMPANDWNKNFISEPLTSNKTAQAANARRTAVKSRTAGPAAARSATAFTNAVRPDAAVDHYEEIVATPVSYMEATVSQKPEIIIKEEISSGKIITKFYQVKMIDGQHTLEPLWMTAELLPLATDTARQKIHADSNHVFRLIPTIQ